MTMGNLIFFILGQICGIIFVFLMCAVYVGAKAETELEEIKNKNKEETDV